MGLLTILVALAAAWGAARYPGAAWLALPALLACVWAGTTLPDIDQPLPLDHRSAATHSALPAAAALARRWAWPVAAGLFLGIGLHLAADFFPNGMTGFATIKVPLGGSLGADGSYAWIGLNALVCGAAGTWLALRGHAPGWRGAALVGAGLIGLVYLAGVDGGWWALATFAVVAVLALRLRRSAAA